MNNNPINSIDPLGLQAVEQGVRMAASVNGWSEEKTQEVLQGANNPKLSEPQQAFVNSLANSAAESLNELGQSAVGTLELALDAAFAVTLGTNEDKQDVSDKVVGIAKQVPDSVAHNWVEAMDYEDKHNLVEQGVYLWGGLGEAFLTVLGGVGAVKNIPISSLNVRLTGTAAQKLPPFAGLSATEIRDILKKHGFTLDKEHLAKTGKVRYEKYEGKNKSEVRFDEPHNPEDPKYRSDKEEHLHKLTEKKNENGDSNKKNSGSTTETYNDKGEKVDNTSEEAHIYHKPKVEKEKK